MHHSLKNPCSSNDPFSQSCNRSSRQSDARLSFMAQNRLRSFPCKLQLTLVFTSPNPQHMGIKPLDIRLCGRLGMAPQRPSLGPVQTERNPTVWNLVTTRLGNERINTVRESASCSLARVQQHTLGWAGNGIGPGVLVLA